MCSQLVLAGTKTACCYSGQPAWTAWTRSMKPMPPISCTGRWCCCAPSLDLTCHMVSVTARGCDCFFCVCNTDAVAIGTRLMHGLETQLTAWQLSRLTTPAWSKYYMDHPMDSIQDCTGRPLFSSCAGADASGGYQGSPKPKGGQRIRQEEAAS